MYCEECGCELDRTARFCHSCGAAIVPSNNLGDTFTAVTDAVCNAAGVDKISRFKISELLSEAFRKHTRAEFEEHVYVGLIKTTPAISKIKAEWPKPWMFVRCFSISVLLYALFTIGLKLFSASCCVSGIVLMGSVAIPLSVALIFFELNIWKNIAVLSFGRAMLVGGVVAIGVTFFLDTFLGSDGWSSALAGFVEEPAKLIALVLIARGRGWNYKLNGLTLGAAIGAGFSIFESMGYALAEMISAEDVADGISALQSNVLVRGVLSAFCDHTVWTAIAGAALWRVKNTDDVEARNFFSFKFLRLLIIPVACHAIHNWAAEDSIMAYCVSLPILSVISWLIVLSLTQEGIKEVAEIKGRKEIVRQANDQT